MRDVSSKVLVVDLDGTFAKNDLFIELVIKFIIQKPFHLILLIFRHLLNENFMIILKNKVFSSHEVLKSDFLINDEVLKFITSNKSNYQKIILMTATPDEIAKKFLIFFDIFNEAYGSTTVNLKGRLKVLKLTDIGYSNFDYIGDSRDDEPIFCASQKSWVIKKGKLCLN
jgi:hypothetical protein